MSNIDNPVAPTEAASNPDEPKTAELRRDIAHTRAEMAGTLAAIEHRLSPKELKEQALVEFHEIEGKVKGVIDEKVSEVRTILKNDLIEAKDVVSRELKHAVDGAKHAMREATVGRVEELATRAGDFMNQSRDTLIDTIKQNPIPAAITGFGIAWLLMNRSRTASPARAGRDYDRFGSRGGAWAGEYDDEFIRRTWPNGDERGHGSLGSTHRRVGDAFQSAQRGVSHAVEQAQAGVSHAYESAQHGIGDAVDRAQHGVGAVVDEVGHAVGSAASQASQFASSTADQISGAASQVASQASHAASQAVDATGALVYRAGDAASHLAHDAGQFVSDAASGTRTQFVNAERAFERTVHDNPVAVAGVAIALGALVGFALPRTDREDKLLAPARDRVLEQAGVVAHQAAAAVHQASDQAVSFAGRTAQAAQQAIPSAQQASSQPAAPPAPKTATT